MGWLRGRVKRKREKIPELSFEEGSNTCQLVEENSQVEKIINIYGGFLYVSVAKYFLGKI